MTKVALVYGFWGQNIGNAFFNLGGHRLLSEIPNVDTLLVQDAPAYWTLHRKKKGNFRNWRPFVFDLDFDLLVLQGPVLAEYASTIWKTILRPRGGKHLRYALVGAGFFRYNAEEISAVRAFLRECPPEFISTRDDSTYDLLRDLDVPIHRGVDSGFFVSDAYPSPSLRRGVTPHIAVCLDFMPEVQLPASMTSDSFSGLRFASRAPRPLEARFQQLAYLRKLAELPKRDSQAGRTPILRLSHRANPHLPFLTYKHASSLVSDEPYTYLAAYGTAVGTVTDRVHAVVASWAYGRPVHFLGKTTRSGLLDRVGRFEGTYGVADARLLSKEKAEVREFLAEQLA